MKRLLLLLVFAPFCSFSQIVNIPDANFKSKLLSASPGNTVAYSGGYAVQIDTNNNSQIELAEASVIDSLKVESSAIANLTGITSFANLKLLNCDNNNIATLDLAGMSLTALSCYSNGLTSLNVAGMNTLEILYCRENSLTTLDLTGLSALRVLYCEYNQITALDFSGVPALEILGVSGNPLISLDLSGHTSLHVVYAEGDVSANGTLTTIDVSGCTALFDLNAGNNALTAVNVTGCNALYALTVPDNQLTSLVVSSPALVVLNFERNMISAIDLSALESLETILCTDNQLSILDVSGLTNLNVIYADGPMPEFGTLTALNAAGCTSLNAVYASKNQLATVDFTGCTALYGLYLDDNQLATIDLSTNPELEAAYINNNPPLQTVVAKNGNNEYVGIFGCPNIYYVCADESQITAIQNSLNSVAPGATCNSYCSFIPGGAYNTISGNIRFDTDGNGCDAGDDVLPQVKINISNGTSSGALFTNIDGSYITYVQQPDITLTPQIEVASYFNISPANATFNFPTNDYSTQTSDFCITPNGVHADLEIVIVPIDQPRPGFDANYNIIYRNKGNQMLSGNLDFSFQDDVLDFVSASIVPDVQATNQLGWNYAGLLPFETRTISLTLNVNSPTETPAVNIGDELNFSATINPVVGDELPFDNVFGFKQTVVGSFDPNDKHCMQGVIAPPSQIGNYLHYVINFENTGTFAAEKVVIKDLIDIDKFDISSLQVLSASHSEIPVITNNKVEFFFQNINLQPNAYGYVAYKIKTKPDLPVGTTVTNKANIYFDFNFPIETNTASTTFQNLGIDNPVATSLRVFPNPAGENVNIHSAAIIRIVTLYDVQGRQLSRHRFDAAAAAVDLSALHPGIYVLQILTDAGIKTERLIKK